MGFMKIYKWVNNKIKIINVQLRVILEFLRIHLIINYGYIKVRIWDVNNNKKAFAC